MKKQRSNTNTEKRGNPRVQKLFMIAYLPQEEQPSRTPISLGRTVDISSSGVGMEVYREVAIGTVMEMEIDLSDIPFPARGRVVRTEALADGNFHIGIKFDEQQDLLQSRLSMAELAMVRSHNAALETLLLKLVKSGWPWDADGTPNGMAHAFGDGFTTAMREAKRLLGPAYREIAALPEAKG